MTATFPPGPALATAVQTWHWLRRPLPFLDECAARFGDVFTINLLGFHGIVLSADPELNREVFGGDPQVLQAGQANLPLKPFLGANSLLMLDGAEHQRQRRMMTPAFHSDRVHAYGRAMIEAARASLPRWPLQRRFSLHQQMQEITLQIIVRTVFGFQEGPQAERIAAVLTQALDLAAWPGMLLPLMQHELGPLRRITPWGRFQALFRNADAMLAEEVARRRAASGHSTSEDSADAMALLLAARDERGQPLSFAELRDELITLLVAGHETTATALCWAFVFLLRDPPLHERLLEELRGLGADPTPERVARLPLLDATVREALRLQPVVPLVGRVLSQPLTLRGRALPAGAMIAPSIYLTQRRNDLYPRADHFWPDRFLQPRGEDTGVGRAPGPGEWLPFGGGTRRCLGAAFATYEMKMVLATLLPRVTLRLWPGATYHAARRSVTLTPADGTPVLAESVRA